MRTSEFMGNTRVVRAGLAAVVAMALAGCSSRPAPGPTALAECQAYAFDTWGAATVDLETAHADPTEVAAALGTTADKVNRGRAGQVVSCEPGLTPEQISRNGGNSGIVTVDGTKSLGSLCLAIGVLVPKSEPLQIDQRYSGLAVVCPAE
jgi:hypothetical protein